MISQFKNIFLFILFSFFFPTSVLARNLAIKSLGHSSFLIKSQEKSILINPFKAIDCASNLKEPKEDNVDFILASSRLLDEGYNPKDKLMFVDPGTYQFEDILLNGISVPHDRVDGRRFGMATVWTWEQNNLKIVHMGGAAGDIDINSQIILSRPDILFISIGGGKKSYDGEEASKIVKILNPNVVIPVHFARGKQIKKECDFSNADLFIDNMKDFKVKYVGKDFQIKPKKIDQNVIYIFSD
ncbi:MBL fold metallo-hydrolase [Prochlorococcus marinus str. MU1404]|uniref:MBL fold metallo-hydrolase n=1 Tax=Prochlorococcus marinus TaxID=1219 RepID=UPI001ADC99FD|nr:MBL fold metallo-hydrolase [Prochlorococcus marinus]MBO8229356.1 MBL fold metallo-hydrolase [Prochlorococcus marinus XMU1404]MBW3072439.1 MBL fold metallo-hydrolase [Prochlorococcus marinus str. MU1404]MCR8544460.1 MBL fold metallo-hydrolase [Prochlorococcus marinus CUG1432]